MLRYFAEKNDDRLLLVNLGDNTVARAHAGTASGSAARFRMDDSLVERFRSLRRSGNNSNRNAGQLDVAWRGHDRIETHSRDNSAAQTEETRLDNSFDAPTSHE